MTGKLLPVKAIHFWSRALSLSGGYTCVAHFNSRYSTQQKANTIICLGQFVDIILRTIAALNFPLPSSTILSNTN
jgi:hypothetical protein